MNAIKISSTDNVAVATAPIKKGEAVFGVTAKNDIPFGHKIALLDVAEGENIIKYGSPIGHASAPIAAGEHVHSHNLKTNLAGKLQYAYEPIDAKTPGKSAATFMGYLRADGSVGIRNEIWIIPTVGCVNQCAKELALRANEAFSGLTDGIFTFPHPYGCSQLGEDHTTTQKILSALSRHPNAAGVLVLGLGCENNNIPEFQKVLGAVDNDRVKFFSVQDADDEISAGLSILQELVTRTEGMKRVPCPVSALKIGLKCGGSDAFSGITANPMLGRLADRLTTEGGTAILTEVPEMFGAERFLMNRAKDPMTFQKVVSLINGFKEYYIRHKQVIYENPSPGNKAGGITTLEEKSLGCTQKSGHSAVCDVLHYGEVAQNNGLNLLEGPGNDIVATTALTAAGAHLILFTTGRGTPLGAPVPTVKVATNTPLALKKPHWIDFNAGALLDGEDEAKVDERFWNYVLSIAEGKKTDNEEHDYREIAIFKDGVTL